MLRMIISPRRPLFSRRIKGKEDALILGNVSSAYMLFLWTHAPPAWQCFAQIRNSNNSPHKGVESTTIRRRLIAGVLPTPYVDYYSDNEDQVHMTSHATQISNSAIQGVKLRGTN
ncbi:unnamed protein product [Leptosia nina]|uniref:Uncharacterized protein n=1 Tax=Leptosia nina TaxID=320188 RepID=A0AAV1JJZ4_9NEOP